MKSLPPAILSLVLCAGIASAESPPNTNAPAGYPAGSLEDEFKLLSEPVVTAASRRVQLLSEAPSSVTVITSREIERFGYLSLADLLSSVRSFYISDDRNYKYVGVRGFARPSDYNYRVLFMLNGHPVNENVFDSTVTLGPEVGIDLETVERVEIVRGPGSSLYGSNAVFAVVNVITKSGAQTDGYRAAAIGGDLGRFGANLSYGQRTAAGTDYRISGSFLRADGEDLYFREFDHPATNFGVAEGLDQERSHQFSFQLERGNWFVQAYHSRRNKDVPTASFDCSFNNDAYFNRDTSTFVDLRYKRRLSREVEITARGYYDMYEYRGIYPWDDPPRVVINDDFGDGQWVGEELMLAWQSSPSHRFSFGQGIEWTYHASLQNVDRQPHWEYVDVSESFAQYWAFVHDEWRTSERITLSFGARLDHHDSFGFHLSPRLAAVVDATDVSTLKLLIGTAYRAPNVYERFYADYEDFAPAADLDPERMMSYELIYERRVDPYGTIAVSAFRNDVRNLISPVTLPSGLARFENIDTAVTDGLEVEGRLALPTGLLAYGNASYTRSRDGFGDRLTNSPEHAFKAGVSVPVVARTLFISPEYRYLGPRQTIRGDETPADETLNLTVLWRLRARQTSISFSVQNVFDRENYVPGSLEHVQDEIIQQGRTYFLKLRSAF